MAVVFKNLVVGEQVKQSNPDSPDKKISIWDKINNSQKQTPVDTVPFIKKKKIELPAQTEETVEKPIENHIVKQEDGVLITHYNKKSSYMVDMIGIDQE